MSGLTINKIIRRIVYTWSVEEVEHFILNKMNETEFFINSENSQGRSALGALVQLKMVYSDRDKAVMNILLGYGADPLIPYNGSSALLDLPVLKLSKIFILFLQHVEDINVCLNSLGTTPLMLAVQSGLTTSVEYICQRGACVDMVEKRTRATALHISARTYGNAEIFRMLLEKGANTNLKDICGKTAFQAATELQQEEKMQIFLAHKLKTECWIA